MHFPALRSTRLGRDWSKPGFSPLTSLRVEHLGIFCRLLSEGDQPELFALFNVDSHKGMKGTWSGKFNTYSPWHCSLPWEDIEHTYIFVIECIGWSCMGFSSNLPRMSYRMFKGHFQYCDSPKQLVHTK